MKLETLGVTSRDVWFINVWDKNILNKINGGLDIAEEKINSTPVDTIQNETQREKKRILKVGKESMSCGAIPSGLIYM